MYFIYVPNNQMFMRLLEQKRVKKKNEKRTILY